MHMHIGIPREIKPGELRVAGLPRHVAQLTGMGCPVTVQQGAGQGGGYDDQSYRQAGAEIVKSLTEVYANADLMWKVKEIQPEEFGLIADRHVIYTYLHACPRPQMTQVLCEARCVAIAYEEMVDDRGRRPLLAPMSILAGAGAIAVAVQYCQSKYQGCGKLFFRTEDAEPVTVVIIGAGTAGRAAARAALDAGAQVHLLEKNESFLPELRTMFPDAEVLAWSPQTFEELLGRLDVLLNCTLWMPGNPRILRRDMLKHMRRGSLIVDVSADPNGAIETSEETTHDDPIRIVEGVLHYGVQNIPALFARTASGTLANATWPYLEKIISQGMEGAIRQDATLRQGVVVWRGQPIGQDLARAQDITTASHDDLLNLI